MLATGLMLHANSVPRILSDPRTDPRSLLDTRILPHPMNFAGLNTGQQHVLYQQHLQQLLQYEQFMQHQLLLRQRQQISAQQLNSSYSQLQSPMASQPAQQNAHTCHAQTWSPLLTAQPAFKIRLPQLVNNNAVAKLRMERTAVSLPLSVCRFLCLSLCLCLYVFASLLPSLSQSVCAYQLALESGWQCLSGLVLSQCKAS